MSAILVFVFLLIGTFLLLLYFLKPTSTEVAVKQRLADVQTGRAKAGDGSLSILKSQTFSSTPWLNDFIKQVPGSAGLSRLIEQAGKEWKVSSVLFGSVATTLAIWWLASQLIGNDLLALFPALAVGCSPLLFLWVLREHRFKRFDDLLPEAVDLMSRGLRAGHSIAAVLEMVGNEVSDPVGSEFRALHKEQTLGLPMREAMVNLIDRMPRDDMRFIATAILLQKESGGNLVQILDKTAILVRERARLRGQLRIYTAQGRITGWILCFAPFAMFGLLSVINRHYTTMLFTEPLGIHMIEAALVMMVLGVLVIRKIIDVKV